MSVCLVTDDKLGAMGEPHVIKYKGREIKFSCEGCEKDFRDDTEKYVAEEKYLAELDTAAKSSTAMQSTQESSAKGDAHKHEHDHKH